jgi:hypothetical protein
MSAPIRKQRPWCPPAWRVRIERHTVARWLIPTQTFVLPAVDEADARLEGCREAHRRQSLPPWRPLLRASWPFASAREVTVRAEQAA